MQKPKVIAIDLLGAAYKHGRKSPGYSTVFLDNGEFIVVPEEKAIGLNGALLAVKHLADIEEYQKRLNIWVETGIMPPQS